MAEKKNPEVEIFIKQDVEVKINGKKIKFKKGKQKVSSDIARILKSAGYAENI